MHEHGDKFVAGAFGPLRDVRMVSCVTCVHAHEAGIPVTCDAFPEEIIEGLHAHTTPYEGDHGILYARRRL